MSIAPRSRYDFAILGGGRAAESAAEEVRRRGLTVAVVERRTRTGVDERHHARRLERLTALGVDVIAGDGRFVASGLQSVTIAVTTPERLLRQLSAENVIVATGVTPAVPTIQGLEDVHYLTSTTAGTLREPPSSLIVVGGGAAGIEQAQLFHRLGVQTTIIEAADRIAPLEDPEVSGRLDAALRAEGIRIRTGATLTSVREASGGVLASALTADGSELQVAGARILIATGRQPDTADLGLSLVGLSAGPGGELPVDSHLRTAHPRIWGAGDVTGAAQFVDVARAQGRLAVANALECPCKAFDDTARQRRAYAFLSVTTRDMTSAEAEAARILA